MSVTDHRPPLSDFRCFQTYDVDEAREIVARHFCSHRLERRSASDRFDACQNRVPGKRLSLNYIRYGADVTIDPGELSHFYLIQIPIAGTAQVRNGVRSVYSTPFMGSVLNPDRSTTMQWHEGCEQVLVQIEKTFMQEVAVRMAGTDLTTVRFAPELDMQNPSVAAWARLLRGLYGAADDGEIFRLPEETHQRMLEETLVTSLLQAQPSTVSPLLGRGLTGAAPAVLRRALNLINERFEDDLSLLDICAYAGTTPRNLQILFKRELGCSPMEKLQDVRLTYARHLLLSQGGNASIADIASHSGHRHAGRFSVSYKARFGESPRDTLRGRPFG
ncbi:AraC family transcriptional regulator [Roseibium sp. MMSF_3544]|uniref:AraC family transcriptional regulator n=1 Tax=unclassified Roseibium TaxID=2629323 RepID=UPI0027401593|nr:AraC family transcriptional regulator [Roseibium sp. MMSF_3544]